jgi:hypothetical protein
LPSGKGTSHRHWTLQQPTSFPPITPPLCHSSPGYPYLPRWSTNHKSFQHGLTIGCTIFPSNPNLKPTHTTTPANPAATTSAKLEFQEQPLQQPIPPEQIRKSSSRRTFQSHIKRKNNKKSTTLTIQNKNKLQKTSKHCLVTFSFQSNPDLNLQTNFNNAIRHPASHLFQQPTNLAFHNLCSLNTLPIGCRELLGLNLKFCIATNKLHCRINKTMLKMANTIRTQYFLNKNGTEGTADYIKQLYIKNKYWSPPPASNRIEESITHCEKQ